MLIGAEDVGCNSVIAVNFFIFFTRKSWFENNRPIITAEIKTHSAENSAITYDIVVHNTGNHPAADILLIAKEESINNLLAETATSGDDRSPLNYGAKLPIKITLQDQDGVSQIYNKPINRASVAKNATNARLVPRCPTRRLWER